VLTINGMDEVVDDVDFEEVEDDDEFVFVCTRVVP
jgi:hypothetical protein